MRRPARLLATVLAPIVTLAAIGCGEESRPPTGPADAEPLPAASSAVVAAATAPLQFSQVSSGGAHTCGITTDGQAYCWGSNFRGQLGDGLEATETAEPGRSPSRPAPLPPDQCGRSPHLRRDRRRCGLLLGRQFPWGTGRQDHNRPGDPGPGAGRPSVSRYPGEVPPPPAASLRPTSHTAGATNNYGQVGDNTIIQRLVPRLVRGRPPVPPDRGRDSTYACGVTTSDKAYCWGRNASGQLGDGTTTDRHLPTAVAGGRAYKTVSVSTEHTCGFTTGGAVYCWGLNSEGALGDGTTTSRTRPVLAKTTGTLDGATVGDSHSCALRNDGRVLCWGSNVFGQVGDATTFSQRLLPVQVVGSGNYDAIEAGTHSHLRRDGRSHRALLGQQPVGPARPGDLQPEGRVPAGSRAAALRAGGRRRAGGEGEGGRA